MTTKEVQRLPYFSEVFKQMIFYNSRSLKGRIIQFLKNVWTSRYWWKAECKVNPPILSSDQMLLHRNESGSQKSLNFSGSDQSCSIKENHHLTRERSTVMTIVCSSNAIKTPPLEFLSKAKGIRDTVNPPDRATVQWSDKGSYTVEHVSKCIESLPTIPIHFAPEKRRIFTLDDYSAHLVPEVEEAFFKKGYFFIIIGGEITGGIQANDTSYHKQVKSLYCKHEMELMLEKLQKDKKKFPKPTRDEMLSMFQKSWNETCAKVSNENVFKTSMIKIALDGSEDHLASKKLMLELKCWNSEKSSWKVNQYPP